MVLLRTHSCAYVSSCAHPRAHGDGDADTDSCPQAPHRHTPGSHPAHGRRSNEDSHEQNPYANPNAHTYPYAYAHTHTHTYPYAYLNGNTYAYAHTYPNGKAPTSANRVAHT